MSQVDFYILGENSHKNIHQMACRLCEKATEQHMNVLLYAKSALQAQELDDLLWTFKADSFIAHDNLHNPIASTINYHYPVLIGSAEQPPEHLVPEQYPEFLINLTAEIPPFYQHFKRLAEMVDGNSTDKEMARNRYRYYRQLGHTLNKFDL